MILSTDHVSIQTSDFGQALHFYHVILGLPIVREPYTFKTRTLCHLSAGTLTLELYSAKSDDGQIEPYQTSRAGLDHIAFIVSDLDAAIQTLRDRGVEIVKEPFVPPSSYEEPSIAFIAGPDGQQIELRQGT